VDQATQYKFVGSRLRIAAVFTAALTGLLMVNLPASHAAYTPIPDTSLEAVPSVDRGTKLASLGGSEIGSSDTKDHSSLSGGLFAGVHHRPAWTAGCVKSSIR
jgi:hypothetical protein